jgi:hypothetical protein
MIITVIGLLIVLFLWFLYLSGYRIERPVKTPKIDDENKRELEKINKEFSEVVNYNLTKALERKH